jgi:hypothetical protein
MGFLVITFSNMLSLRADRQFGVLGDGLGGRIHVGDIDVGELGGGNDASPIFGRIRPPRRECNRAPRVDLDGRLIYATDSNQDLIFRMDAWLSC